MKSKTVGQRRLSPGKWALASSAAVILAVAFSPDAQAQAQNRPAYDPEQTTGLEDVVVTAQRREQRIQDVPVVASAFSEERLEQMGVESTLDVARHVPNLFAQHNTGLGTANGYFLRGIGSVESIATFDTPVGAYIDDIYISRQNANNFALFDVDRIEVLRGPQGTLFGRNTTGGSVNVYVRRPADEFTGFVEAGVGSFGERQGRINVNLPISETLRTKISAYTTSNDGYVENVVTGETLNGNDNWGVRAAASLDLSDAVSWNGSVARMHDEDLNVLNFACNPLQPTQCDGRYSASGLASTIRTATGRFNTTVPVSGAKGDNGMGNVVDTTLVTSDLQVNLGGATLNIITGYIDTDQSYGIDFFDGRANAYGYTFAGSPPVATFSANQMSPPVSLNPNGNFTLANEGRFEQVSQEVKLTGELFDGRINYVTGLFYIREDNSTDYADIFGTLLLADRILNNTLTSYAGYAQADWALTDAITLTAGIRYTDETKTIDFFDNRPACAASQAAPGCISSVNFATTVFPSGATIPLEQSAQVWTPRFAASWKPNEDMLFFASATKGFRSGGWNARSSSVLTILPFAEETTWSYELGAKTDWLDGRFRANATLFRTEIEGLQTLSSFANPTTGALTFISGNYADQVNEGLELEFQALPIEGLTLFANIGLQNPRYVIDTTGPLRNRYNVLTVNTQLQECRAGLAGAASPLVADTRTAAARAQAYCGSGIVTPTGRISDVVRAPDLTASFGGAYEIDLGSMGLLTPSIAVTYSGETETGSSNVNIYRDNAGAFNLTSGDLVTGSFAEAATVVSLSTRWDAPGGDWSATLSCDNCTDEVYVQSALSNFSYINAPRSWSFRVRREF